MSSQTVFVPRVFGGTLILTITTSGPVPTPVGTIAESITPLGTMGLSSPIGTATSTGPRGTMTIGLMPTGTITVTTPSGTITRE